MEFSSGSQFYSCATYIDCERFDREMFEDVCVDLYAGTKGYGDMIFWCKLTVRWVLDGDLMWKPKTNSETHDK